MTQNIIMGIIFGLIALAVILPVAVDLIAAHRKPKPPKREDKHPDDAPPKYWPNPQQPFTPGGFTPAILPPKRKRKGRKIL